METGRGEWKTRLAKCFVEVNWEFPWYNSGGIATKTSHARRSVESHLTRAWDPIVPGFR